jgi:catechol 2,3-dioxygenase-like lactoylglutathione lyase family enzyme
MRACPVRFLLTVYSGLRARQRAEESSLNIKKEMTMKRFHVHVAVSDLKQSTQFYSAMFGMQPTVQKDDYAKWMLDDPRVNFAISERGTGAGINHLGFQAEDENELEEIHQRLQTADTTIAVEKNANCCYATSDKYWVKDPSGIAWETFRSLNTIPFYGEDSHKAEGSKAGVGSACGGTACCPPSLSAPKSAESVKQACCNG